MNIQYFSKNLKTLEELKKEYKKLVLQFHPDLNKNKNTTKDFQNMQNEYELLFEQLKNFSYDKNGNVQEKVNKENVKIYKDIINKIVFFEGITITIIGSWLWIEGNTYQYKEQLKNLNFKFSKNKKAWYYASDLLDFKVRGRYNMTQLKNKWNIEHIETEKIEKLA